MADKGKPREIGGRPGSSRLETDMSGTPKLGIADVRGKAADLRYAAVAAAGPVVLGGPLEYAG